MSKIEFSRSSFHKFLVLATLQKNAENKELLAKFTDQEVTTLAHSPGKYVSFKGTLKGKFGDWGDIGIDDLIFLRNFIGSTTSDSIFLKKTENKLISDANDVKFTAVLRNPKYITNVFPQKVYDDFKKTIERNEFKLKSESIKKIIANAGTIKDYQFISLSGSKNKFNITFDNLGNELNLSFDVDKDLEDFSIKVNNLFIDVISLISDYDLTIATTNDARCVSVGLKTNELEFEYFIGLVKK